MPDRPLLTRRIRRPAFAAAVVALSVLYPACTVDDDIVTAIGTTRLFVVDSSLRTQTVSAGAAEATIQVAEWDITGATLTLGTMPPLDLTFGDNCAFADTALVRPFGQGKCAAGIVVDADGEVRPATLDLTFKLINVRRAEPLALPLAGDFDGDGVTNAADNCPLIDNPDQTDSRMAGFGDACGILDLATGNVLLDNDGDRVPDVADNCAHVVNPGQEDAGLKVDNTTTQDGIGDACDEQMIMVEGGTEIQVTLGPEDLLQPLNRVSYLTVDFRDEDSLTCNWQAGVCELDPAQIRFCILNTAVGFCL